MLPFAKIGSDRLRAVPTPAPRTTAPRDPSRRKWAEIEPSLFDAPASDVAAPAVEAVEGQPVTPEPATEPVWMPRFGPDTELDDVLDDKTPLLRRAFGGR